MDTLGSESSYLSLFESIDEGFCLVQMIYDQSGKATDFRFQQVNEVFEMQFGYHGAKGRLATDLVPNFTLALIDTFDSVARTGKPVRIEAFFEDRARWYTITISRIGNASQGIVASLFDDITQRKQHERQQAYLLTLSDALRDTADSIAIEETVTQLAMQEFGADRCYYCRIEGGNAIILRDARQGDLPSVAGTYPLSSFVLLKNVVDAGQPFVVDNAASTAILDEDIRAICLQMSVISFMNVPVTKNGQVVGILCTVQSTPRHWRQDEILLAIETAERTWAAVERAKAEEALVASQKRFESIANLVPDLLWETRPDGLTSWLNQRWLDYTGQRVEEAIGWGWAESIHPEDREASARRYGQAVARGTALRQEHRIRRFDGVYRWFVVHALPLLDQRGKVVKMYGAATDIEDLKQLEASLREADRRKDEFLAMLAHELRNPMSTLRSGISILKLSQGAISSISNVILMMDRQTEHLVRMVDDLLDAGRVTHGKIVLKVEQLALAPFIQDTVQAMLPNYEAASKELHFINSTTNPIVEADPTRLSQIITNLLTNALRYTGPDGKVEIGLEEKNGEVIIRVSDNGIGLSPEQQTTIFELFVQADNSLAHTQGGFGIGLTLVKNLVEMHGGKIEVRSPGLGRGSDFLVCLPIAKAANRSAPRQTSSNIISKFRILIIDDNDDAALVLAMLLRMKGCTVNTCNNGRAGIEAAETDHPDIILCDIGMPGLDGFQTAAMIRQQSWGRNIILIALSGYGQEEDKQAAIAAGFDGHFTKPIELEELQQLINTMVKRKEFKLTNS